MFRTNEKSQNYFLGAHLYIHRCSCTFYVNSIKVYSYETLLVPHIFRALSALSLLGDYGFPGRVTCSIDGH